MERSEDERFDVKEEEAVDVFEGFPCSVEQVKKFLCRNCLMVIEWCSRCIC